MAGRIAQLAGASAAFKVQRAGVDTELRAALRLNLVSHTEEVVRRKGVKVSAPLTARAAQGLRAEGDHEGVLDGDRVKARRGDELTGLFAGGVVIGVAGLSTGRMMRLKDLGAARAPELRKARFVTGPRARLSVIHAHLSDALLKAIAHPAGRERPTHLGAQGLSRLGIHSLGGWRHTTTAIGDGLLNHEGRVRLAHRGL